VAKLREVWGGKGANAVKAGREYEVRVAQRILRELSKKGKGKEEEKEEGKGKGKWQLPKRVAKHQQRKQAEGVAVQNVFAPLTNIDTEPIEHGNRGRGEGGRRVKVVSVNLAGGKARVAELRRVVEIGALRAEVIAVQETWLKGEEILTIPGYTYIGSNREKQGKRGEGGVGVFVAGHLVATRVREYKEQEWVWVRIEVKRGRPLYICSMYGPQEEERREEVERVYSRLGQQISTLQEKGHILLVGDLNAKIGKGGERVGKLAGVETSPNGVVVVRVLEEQKLWSLLDRDELSSGPTFYSTGGNSTIDHIITSKGLWEGRARARVRRDLEIGSDHIPVEVEVRIGVDQPPKQKGHKRWKVESLERDEVQQKFAEKIERGKIEGGVEERWKEWKRRIRVSAGEVVGEKRCGGKRKVGWWDREMAEVVERRREAFHRMVEAEGGKEEWREYIEKRREVKRVAQAKRTRFSAKVGLEIVEAQAVGGKRMWTLLKQIGWHPRDKAAGMDINNSNGQPVRSVDEALEAWANYFEDLGKGPKGEKFDEEYRERVERELVEWCEKNKKREGEEEDNPITEEEIEKAIKLSKNGRAPGSSGIPNELVKAGGGTVVKGLREVFQQCWVEEKTPRQIKKGLICPVFKDGEARDPNNYRGITVTSAVGKLYGRVLLGRIQGWCEGWLGEEQAGFRAKRGCEEQRVILAEAVSKANRLKEPLFLAFIDFRKAYDYVWRQGLWWKLIKKGVDPKILRVLMELYQENPTQVGVGGWKTKVFNILAGLKQGCVLSPTLFIIFLDDLIEEIKKVCPGYRVGVGLRVSLLLFADDLVIMANTQRELQAALEVLSEYCRIWRLQVNLKKCKVVMVGKAKMNGPIKYRGEPMEIVKEFVYLGIPIQGTGGWNGAIKRAIEKARKRTAKLRGILGDRRLPIALRSELVRLVVRGTLEFGLEGVDHKDRKELETVMHQAAVVVLGCNRYTAQVAVRGELGWLSVKNSILKNKVQLVRRAEERVREKPDSLYARVWTAGWNNPCSRGLAAQARRWKKELVGEEGGEEEEVSWTVRGEERVRERDVEEWRKEGEEKKSLRPYMQAKLTPVREPYLYFLPAKLASFRFKIKSQTLPVAAFLAKQGRGGGECRMCGGKEDLQHFLLVCRGLEEEREKCLQVAGFDISQQLFDWLLRSENKVNCSTPEVEWKISEAVYRMWKTRLRVVYQGQPGPNISHGETPQHTNPHHTSPCTMPPPGTDTNNDSVGPSHPNQDISNTLIENQAQVTVPRVNGSSGPKIVN
jgi:exonuclease III